MRKIAIVGAGVIGRVLALELLKELPGIQVEIFDKDLDGHKSCSYNAGGMIAPISELINCQSHVYESGYNSLKLWQELVEPKNNIIEKFNTLLLAHKYDGIELDLAHRSIAFRVKEYNRVMKDIEAIGYQDLIQLEPIILNSSICDRAYIIKNEGAVNVAKFFDFTNKRFYQSDSVNFRQQNIKQIRDKHIYIDKSTKYEYDQVFDCRGFSSKQSLELYGVRGEAVVIQHQGIKLNSVIRLAHPRHPLYIVPRGKGVFYLGATSIASDENSPISVQSLMELLSMAMVIDKKFAEARILKTLTAVRPTSIDDRPIIKYTQDCIYINGLSRHGFLFAPKIAKDLVGKLREGI